MTKDERFQAAIAVLNGSISEAEKRNLRRLFEAGYMGGQVDERAACAAIATGHAKDLEDAARVSDSHTKMLSEERAKTATFLAGAIQARGSA